eukprot:CAMPEP_0172415780 /NCGR_PEP_ID=MMETSP1064-20121228/2231_1 /TAXON_ID=202472 /ORGANISM="Aulacoseira subarctica , Strain CCAP 1002/5" /LENGTH=336 /DNA_ID=CAMNT_0013153015 /DNA_START=44 /DNA_END=1051 /DNA_ORIENTATION=+
MSKEEKGQRNPKAKKERTSFGCSDEVKNLSFPAKLHAILSHRDIVDIVSWVPHGRAWRIHIVEEFEQVVLPSFFHKCKHSSFLRQLNGWGFRRMTDGPDWNAFHHDYFLRGDLQRCRLMARLEKSRASAAPNHHTCDPDVYALPFMPELTQTFCLYGGNNNPAELLAPATDPAEDRESAAVALLAVGASGTAICTTTSTSTTSRSSSNKRPRSKSNETKSFKKKRADEGIPPIPASLVDISHPTTTNGPELMTWVRNPPSLTLVPPQWSAATTTAAFLPLQQEQVRSILLAAPTTYLPSTTTNVFIPSSSADVVDMEFHARILRAQEDITRLSSAW